MYMSSNAEMNSKQNPKTNERIFFLCEDCMWSITCLDKSQFFKVVGKDGVCPMCHQDQLSSFPLISNNPFTYSYLEKKGIEVKFANKEQIKQIPEIESP
jgi:hypothetical protein